MSGPQAHMEFVDVLSSIRRLVSEHKRAEDLPEPADDPGPVEEITEAAAEPPRRLPQESRFVLTAAHRVSPEEFEGEASEEVGFDADEPSGAAEAGLQEGGEEAADPFALVELAEEPAEASAEPGAQAAEAEIASLEETIAELEAAVAGIDEEFEPDLGDPSALDEELEQDAAWSAASAGVLVDLPGAGSREFHGIMGSFDGLSASDERLDLPIIGDVNMPIIPRGDNWRISLPQRRAEMAQEAPILSAGETGGQDGDALAERGPTREETHAETQAATEEPLVLRVAGAIQASGDGDQPSHVATQEVPEWAGPADESLLGASGDDEDAPTTAGEAAAAEDPVDDSHRLHLGPGEASRPAIIRAETIVEDLKGPVSDAVARLDAVFGAAGDDAVDADDGEDLFDPLAAMPVDPDHLRDLVADVIRDQLRGALGERITRNVRVLVRREIERVLAEYGLKRE